MSRLWTASRYSTWRTWHNILQWCKVCPATPLQSYLPYPRVRYVSPKGQDTYFKRTRRLRDASIKGRGDKGSKIPGGTVMDILFGDTSSRHRCSRLSPQWLSPSKSAWAVRKKVQQIENPKICWVKKVIKSGNLPQIWQFVESIYLAICNIWDKLLKLNSDVYSTYSMYCWIFLSIFLNVLF